MDKLYMEFIDFLAAHTGHSCDHIREMVILQPQSAMGVQKILIPQDVMVKHKHVVDQWIRQQAMVVQTEVYYTLAPEPKRPDKQGDVVVIFLPCGSGFIHPPLSSALSSHQEIKQIHINGTHDLLRRLTDCVTEQLRHRPPPRIILHGWSMGGSVILQYLAKRNTPPLLGVFLYAAAGISKRSNGQPNVFLFHNNHDSVIPVQYSHENEIILGGKLIISDIMDGGHNHLCNEFVTETVSIMLSLTR